MSKNERIIAPNTKVFMFDSFKARGFENYLKSEFARFFENGGESVKVDLDTAQKSCSISAVMAGENSPIRVQLSKYEIVSEGEERFLKVVEISSDKKWIDTALSEFLKGKKIKIPLFVAAAL